MPGFLNRKLSNGYIQIKVVSTVLYQKVQPSLSNKPYTISFVLKNFQAYLGPFEEYCKVLPFLLPYEPLGVLTVTNKKKNEKQNISDLNEGELTTQLVFHLSDWEGFFSCSISPSLTPRAKPSQPLDIAPQLFYLHPCTNCTWPVLKIKLGCFGVFEQVMERDGF